MAEVSGDGGGLATPAPLSVSGSFKEGRGSSRRRGSARPPSMDADEFMNLLHGSDPVKVELNRLQNEVRDKDRELSEAQDEIKALRNSKYGIVLEAHAVAIQTCVAANGRRRPRRIVRTTDSFTDVEKKKFQELLKGDEFYRIRLPSNVLLLRLLPSQFQHDNIVRYYGSHKVSEVKGVMMENIEKVLDRGEKIELLVNKTDSLHHQAQDFKSSGTTIRQKMWLQNMKQPPFDKKQFVAYVKRYIKLLTPKLEPEKQELFKKHIEGATKFLLSKLSDLQLWEPRC